MRCNIHVHKNVHMYIVNVEINLRLIFTFLKYFYALILGYVYIPQEN